MKRWDIRCRVVDNFGDAAIMWRLATQLSNEEGRSVRLLIDDVATLAALVPGAVFGTRIDGVTIVPIDSLNEADVVLAGFDAETGAPDPAGNPCSSPTLIRYEYLSAEPWVDRFHASPSPKPDGRIEHFYYPGFSDGSGGLPLERDLLTDRHSFLSEPDNAARFLQGLGVDLSENALAVSYFGYRQAPLKPLLQAAAALSRQAGPLHFVMPSLSVDADRMQINALFAETGLADSALRWSVIPFLTQPDYDRLLWSCDLNFVRGEDSWIRAIWAGKPFVWAAYPQADDTHHVKVDAFLRRLAEPAVEVEAEALRGLLDLHRLWNGLPADPGRPADRTPVPKPLAPKPRTTEWTPPAGESRAIDFETSIQRVLGGRLLLERRLSRWAEALATRRVASMLIRFAERVSKRQL